MLPRVPEPGLALVRLSGSIGRTVGGDDGSSRTIKFVVRVGGIYPANDGPLWQR